MHGHENLHHSYLHYFNRRRVTLVAEKLMFIKVGQPWKCTSECVTSVKVEFR